MTDSRARRSAIVRFLLGLGLWTLAAHAVLAVPQVQGTLVVPFSRWQGALVERYLLTGPLMVAVDPSCSGLDVIALVVAAALAYPTAWPRRIVGALLGVAFLLFLNLVRIATLANASATTWFGTFHIDVWPTVLVAAAATWIAVWVRFTDREALPMPSLGTRRFLIWSILLLVTYGLAVSVLTDDGTLDRAARGAAHLAAACLTALGLQATVTERVLTVGNLQYLITPECITTPLIAFYLAGVLAAPLNWRARALGVVAALPIFSILAILRLLTVALPVAVDGTTLILTHAFNQLLTGAALLVAFSLWHRGGRSSVNAILVALLVSVAAVAVAAPAGPAMATGWARLLATLRLSVPPGLLPGTNDGDGQGALLIQPVFQIGLFAAAWFLARRHSSRIRWTVAGGALLASQGIFLAAQGWMHAAGLRPFSALAIRGWAVLVPVVCVLAAERALAPQDVKTQGAAA